MNRREFMACAIMLAANASNASMHKHNFSDDQKKYIAAATNYNDWQGNFFNAEQKMMIASIADCIIPVTDTPGALAAGVPQFIERMAEEWFTEHEQQSFVQGLAQLQSMSQSHFKSTFESLAVAEKITLLEQLEEEASDSSWYEYGNVFLDFDSDAPFICHIKELTMWGFFTSEVGSTQVLRATIMTNDFKGDIPLLPEDSSWDYLQF
jgi:gluconate 2-dehydrogenase gamma chain